MTLLEICNLSLGFSDFQAVRDVSLRIRAGEMFALVGESGSGKSLTALSVMGLQPEGAKVSGSIRFEGQEITGLGNEALRALRGNDIGMVFQEPMSALNPLHTIGRQVEEAIAVHRGSAARSGVAALLEEVGLSQFKDRLESYPHQLSGGERQRVMIAMAIANRPKLLIADEPTTAVDVTIQAKLLKLLKRLQRERGMAMLFITHDLTLVKRLADTVAVMKEGRIVEQGAVSDVFASPREAYTKALLGAEPKGSAVQPLPDWGGEFVRAEGVSVRFPIRSGLLRRVRGQVEAVRDVSLTIRAGETLGLVGESGSGKTTLALALLKLQPAAGRIVFLGKDISALQPRQARTLRKNMQMVFQDPYSSLNPRMQVEDIVGEGLRVHMPGLSAEARRARVAGILTEVGLEPQHMQRYPHAFSGGQRQRIGIARAMVLEPKLVVLDEPTSALDLTVQAQLIALLKHFQKEKRIGYLFISHDLRVVKSIAHRVLVMRRGEVVEEGQTEALFATPRQDYTKALLDAAYLKAF